MRRPLVLFSLVALLLAAGVGAGYAATSRSAAKHATVKTRKTSLGTILVDGRGRTLYRFMRDTSRTSRCSGGCAGIWPPLTSSEKPEAEGGARASLLSTSRRTGGARQVVYAGRPLYRYAGDGGAGDTNGQGINGFGGRWYVVSASGSAIRSSGASAPPPAPYGY